MVLFTDRSAINRVRLREENSWTKPLQLDGQPIKQFRAAIDKMTEFICLHIVHQKVDLL